jgi:hypothetical protein
MAEEACTGVEDREVRGDEDWDAGVDAGEGYNWIDSGSRLAQQWMGYKSLYGGAHNLMRDSVESKRIDYIKYT